MNNTQPITALIMAGGTGGHVFPALALAQELSNQGHTVEWLGTARGIESRLVPAAGYPLHTLAIGGLRGHGLSTKLAAPWRVARAVWQAAKVIVKVKPQVVVGLGGFAAGPGGIAARLLRKPLVIHEQNAIAGTTNKILARVANKTLVAFPNALANSQCIGNPVREAIEAVPTPAARFADRTAPLRLLVLGGSLGAVAINKVVPAALRAMPEELRPQVRHQTGEKHITDTLAFYREAKVNADVIAFIDDMAEALGWADLIVCRAGALTVAELAAVGVASVLVPFPFAIDDHQTANARFLEGAGAAIVKQQHELTDDVLRQLLTALLADRTKLLAMAEAARTLAVPRSARIFAEICLEQAHG